MSEEFNSPQSTGNDTSKYAQGVYNAEGSSDIEVSCKPETLGDTILIEKLAGEKLT